MSRTTVSTGRPTAEAAERRLALPLVVQNSKGMPDSLDHGLDHWTNLGFDNIPVTDVGLSEACGDDRGLG